MNLVPKTISYILLALLCIVFLSFFISGITNVKPYSEDYNLPVAQSIVSGEFLQKQEGLYIHAPGASHTILAAFIAAGIPLNLFGLLSWVVLFFVCKKLGDIYGLKTTMAIIFAASICTSIAVIRTIGDQSIDKWLCTWFVLSMILLEKPKRDIKYFLYLGLSLGMLFGTKYSGPLFFFALIPIYIKTFWQFLSPMRFIAFGIVFTLVGLFWYIRNFIYEGNPYYPANFPFFKGAPNFDQQDWMLWKIPFDYPENIIPLINSFLSEYMIWTLCGFVLVGYIYSKYKSKTTIDPRIKRLAWLSITTGFVCLLLPITPAYKIELFHIISDMRYIYIFMVIIMLAVFIIADNYKKNTIIAILALLNTVPVFSFIPYQPKLFILVMLIVVLLYFKYHVILKFFNKH